jgi:hypothetical protein
MLRRRFLQLLAAAVPAAPAARARGASARAVPRVNGGINLQPLRRLDRGSGPPIEPELVDLQLAAVYALGFEQVRVTLPFNRFDPNFFAAIPYVRASRALGIDVLGVVSDFAGYSLLQALGTPRSRAAVLNTYRDVFLLTEVEPAAPCVERAGGFALQVLNEPTHALGIDPGDYVREFLGPVNEFFKLRDPALVVVSGAEVGNIDGIYRVRAMIEAGLHAHCDRVAYHVYSRRLVPLLAGLARRPVWITESGAEGGASHLPWVRDVFPEIRRGIAGVERIFFYVLFDAAPGRFRLLDIAHDASGAARARVESEQLVEHLRSRAGEAAGGQPTASYEELIPDIRAYFPTQADVDRVLEALPFLPPG